ncbi:MAG TPA: tRNA preQ1(34) S-adenosylmethionine ribosyltransferase-isomerase QueA [Acidobacteriaceae bacterium]|nr:tRNA preQ1(34) S-adenosylmethionine ribosyltransferase-isomerase QueA [Acidobacteriaceae bacterium]
MLVSQFDFTLPEELIAQEPPEKRGGSRMLLLDRAMGTWKDDVFAQFPQQLRAGDVLVLNDSRVIPARLFGTRARRPEENEPAVGRIEVLLTEQLEAWEWNALVKPGRKLRVGDEIEFGGGPNDTALRAEIVATEERGERKLRFTPVADFDRRLDALGHMPLPPYIHRDDRTLDRERYQTVYARQRGSAAAPTAGLHFTPQVLDEIRAAGVAVRTITLHVGLGTFQPVRVAETAEIRLHSERYEISAECAEAINAARHDGRRIVAAGTTTVRTLEHCAAASADGRLHPHSGSTNIFISPGFRFRIVDALLTNFHLPQSTLLMLVSAFAGRDNTLAAYRHAVEARYRFFSYGDCMFIS